MKKALLVLLYFATILLTTSCNNYNCINNSNDNIIQENDDTCTFEDKSSLNTSIEQEVITSGDYSAVNNLPYVYKQIIDNNKEFILCGEKVFLNEYKSPYLQEYLSLYDDVEYSVLDMDQDGNVELLIRGWNQDILVLHTEKDIVYGYEFMFRDMYNIREDGSFCWNINAGTSYGISRLSFIGENCQHIVLFRVETNYDDSQTKYFVANMQVAEKEFASITAHLPYIKQIVWYKMNE